MHTLNMNALVSLKTLYFCAKKLDSVKRNIFDAFASSEIFTKAMTNKKKKKLKKVRCSILKSMP